LFNLIITLGAATLLLFSMTLIFQMIFRNKRRKVYYRLHRFFGIAAFLLAVVHGTIAVLYFNGVI
jgi:DMSO/TMAO reductase YedYZ heme-binding membrane subunit